MFSTGDSMRIAMIVKPKHASLIPATPRLSQTPQIKGQLAHAHCPHVPVKSEALTRKEQGISVRGTGNFESRIRDF